MIKILKKEKGIINYIIIRIIVVNPTIFIVIAFHIWRKIPGKNECYEEDGKEIMEMLILNGKSLILINSWEELNNISFRFLKVFKYIYGLFFRNIDSFTKYRIFLYKMETGVYFSCNNGRISQRDMYSKTT